MLELTQLQHCPMVIPAQLHLQHHQHNNPLTGECCRSSAQFRWETQLTQAARENTSTMASQDCSKQTGTRQSCTGDHCH